MGGEMSTYKMPRKERNGTAHSVWGITTDRAEIQLSMWRRTAAPVVSSLETFSRRPTK